MEYLVTMTTHVPRGTAEDVVTDVRAREAKRSRELAAQGHLLRLWRPPLQPGEWRTLGLFAADDRARLEDVLASMPLRVWRTDDVTPLVPHPNDPARRREPPGAFRQQAQEFLITFTITVPDSVPAAAVADRKAREARRALSSPSRATSCVCGCCPTGARSASIRPARRQSWRPWSRRCP